MSSSLRTSAGLGWSPVIQPRNRQIARKSSTSLMSGVPVSAMSSGLPPGVRARTPGGNPLLMALTGTPLINDVEDFRAIWRFLGWITGDQPSPALVRRLEDIGLTPADHAFYPAARDAVISMGIVRRRKADVASDLPAKRVVDLPVELDDALGRSIRRAERALGKRLAAR